MTETLCISTLGGLNITLQDLNDGERKNSSGTPSLLIHLETRTTEAVLVYLACQGRPVARELLAEMLWPDRSQHQSLTNLRGALHRLRTKLGTYLQISRQTVALKRNASFKLDSVAFEADCAAGRLGTATTLYRGEFLDGFYLNSSPAFEHWMVTERERLQSLALAAHQNLMSQAITGGHLDVAIVEAQALLHIDPLQESVLRQLLRLLAVTGQRNHALSLYANFRTLLGEELGVHPDDTTTALYEDILNGTMEAAAPTRTLEVDSLQGRVTTGTGRRNLPPPPTPFLGREIDIAEVVALLHNPDCRMVTLLGLGGIGKTRLAIEVAARWAATTADDVCYVALAALNTGGFLAATIAQSLGLTLALDGDLLASLADYLRSRRSLLVFDNAEHLLNGYSTPTGQQQGAFVGHTDLRETITTLLHEAPGLKVLVTSRVRVNLLEEWLWPVAGLPVPDDLRGPAAQLFVDRARRVNPTFDSAGQAAAIVEICRKLEGMPLGIELAAGWTRVMPCAEIAHHIAEGFGFLVTTTLNVPERHQSLRNLFDGSWRLLTHAEQNTLVRLSVFAGGWAAEEASLVADASLPTLLSLADKSLVRTVGDGRFDLHPMVRQFAAERLAASAEDVATRERHFAAYLAIARWGDANLRGPDAAIWIRRLDLEQDNMRAALQWRLATGRSVDAAWLAVALTWFWMRRGAWREAADWLEQIANDADDLPLDLHLAVLLSAYWYAGQMRQEGVAAAYLAAIQSLSPLCQDEDLRVGVVHSTGWYETSFTQAVNGYQRTVDLAHQHCNATLHQPRPSIIIYGIHGDPCVLLCHALYQLAELKRGIGEYEQAKALAKKCLRLHTMRGDRDAIAHAYGALGRLALLDGDIAAAKGLIGDAVATARSIGSLMSIVEWLPWLGIVMQYSGEHHDALCLLNESLELCRLINSHRNEKAVYVGLALNALEGNDLLQAEQWLKDALVGYATGFWIRPELVDCLFLAVRLAILRRDFERAAVIMGLADKYRTEIRHALDAPLRKAWYEALKAITSGLTPESFIAAWKRGQIMTLASVAPVLHLTDRKSDLDNLMTAFATLERYATASISGEETKDLSLVQTDAAALYLTYGTFADLTPREVEVLRLLVEGLTYAQIADKLVISRRAVNGHVSSIYSKMGVTSRVAATRFAFQHRLI